MAAGLRSRPASPSSPDLFTGPPGEPEEGGRAPADAARACRADLRITRHRADFRRHVATRADERCVVELVVDRVAKADPVGPIFGRIRVDSLREIAANRLCTVPSRCEIRDRVDLRLLIPDDATLVHALDDAVRNDAGADPATRAWVLDRISIAPGAHLPGDADAVAVDGFRRWLVERLRALAFARARRDSWTASHRGKPRRRANAPTR